MTPKKFAGLQDIPQSLCHPPAAAEFAARPDGPLLCCGPYSTEVSLVDKLEAKKLLAKELEGWRQRPYADLASLVDGDPVTGEVQSEAGNRYQYEIQVFWDGKPGGDIRVLGAIDDGGVRAFFPLTDDFIVATNGDFIGEDSV